MNPDLSKLSEDFLRRRFEKAQKTQWKTIGRWHYLGRWRWRLGFRSHEWWIGARYERALGTWSVGCLGVMLLIGRDW